MVNAPSATDEAIYAQLFRGIDCNTDVNRDLTQYPYNYIEPPWHYSSEEEQQGYVNLNSRRTHLTVQDIELNMDDSDEINLPLGVPQEVVCQDRYEFIPLPKLFYENYVPLIATRRIVCRQNKTDFSSSFTSQLPQINETTFQL